MLDTYRNVCLPDRPGNPSRRALLVFDQFPGLFTLAARVRVDQGGFVVGSNRARFGVRLRIFSREVGKALVGRLEHGVFKLLLLDWRQAWIRGILSFEFGHQAAIDEIVSSSGKLDIALARQSYSDRRHTFSSATMYAALGETSAV
jgi:hypothetical protein